MARRMGKPAAPTSVEAVKHSGDHRMNIPTAELGALAEKAQTGPQMLRYPRDPSLPNTAIVGRTLAIPRRGILVDWANGHNLSYR